MRSKTLAVIAALVLVLSLGACQKGEDKPISETGGPGMPGGEPGMFIPQQGESEVVVPESVKGKWDAVELTIEDKTTGEMKDVKIALDSEYSIPDSNLKIKVGEFLPDFRMEGLTITSASDEPNNPAVRVTVTEGDEELFKGWLYSKFPAIHPFQNEKYGIMLKAAVEAGAAG